MKSSMFNLKDLLAADQDAIDEMVKEIDRVLGEILDKQKKAEDTSKVKIEDGETCIKCCNFILFSEPNQENGTFICYNCRHYG